MSQVPNSYTSAGAPYRRKFRHLRAPTVSSLMLLRVVAAALLTLIISLITYNPSSRPVWAQRGKTALEIVSPLQALVTENKIQEELLGEQDRILVQKIGEQSSLEFKNLLISETVVPKDSADRLLDFVKTQLLAKEDVIVPKQAAAILEMVRLNPQESVVEIEAIGDKGSLSSSIALALIKHHEDNIHFMLVAVKAEPHLGMWKRLSQAERNSWNGVISKMLKEKVSLETNHYLKLGKVRAVELSSHEQKKPNFATRGANYYNKPASELQGSISELQEPILDPAHHKAIPADEV